MAATKKMDNKPTNILTLDGEIPTEYEAIKNRLAHLDEERKSHLSRVDQWYQGTRHKLTQQLNEVELRTNPRAYVDRVVSEKDAELARLKSLLERRPGKSQQEPSYAPNEEQEAFYKAMVELGEGFRPQKEALARLHWRREDAGPVIRRLIDRGYLEKEVGVRGPAPKLKVTDKARPYEAEDQDVILGSEAA